ncbi:hypothetical protein BC939DRAFT_450584 [Gamsiella multidivaricata]|uniref:uncharacterized protein n=1 Tax=Gamsiella multidivaricata TaxID=101098 RepID=UPI00221ECC50|nr:uncharacterized protein BC939DRAFT_450584 [Gamsiella multidivaricata]KAI7824107.1 hypothetical protein BC939DRAFT_450584 [Gamsiella multidivaricata]
MSVPSVCSDNSSTDIDLIILTHTLLRRCIHLRQARFPDGHLFPYAWSERQWHCATMLEELWILVEGVKSRRGVQRVMQTLDARPIAQETLRRRADRYDHHVGIIPLPLKQTTAAGTRRMSTRTLESRLGTKRRSYLIWIEYLFHPVESFTQRTKMTVMLA